jgi:hypothetical protein
MRNGSAVIAIDVDRHAVDGHNGARWRLCAARVSRLDVLPGDVASGVRSDYTSTTNFLSDSSKDSRWIHPEFIAACLHGRESERKWGCTWSKGRSVASEHFTS